MPLRLRGAFGGVAGARASAMVRTRVVVVMGHVAMLSGGPTKAGTELAICGALHAVVAARLRSMATEKDYWDDPYNVMHHLRGAMGYDEKTKSYKPWDGEVFEDDNVVVLRLDPAGVTDTDLAAWAERLVFPKLERLSLLNNPLTAACLPDVAKIRAKSPRMTHLLLPPYLTTLYLQM